MKAQCLHKMVKTAVLFLLLRPASLYSQSPSFRVIAFFTAKNDAAHISFVHEANRWFWKLSVKDHFAYDSTSDWSALNAVNLCRYQVVIFLDTRPEDSMQRAAFESYMEHGGGWMGFHFAAFSLTPSAYPENWSWYHEHFLGCGAYWSNTWRPTSAILKVEAKTHPAMQGLPATFLSAPNEWYRWKDDLRQRQDIRILASIDPRSFPLGTGPKPSEIWHNGYYPVVWTNTSYHMIYFNMGHNDMDYEHGTNGELSHTFQSAPQNRMIEQSLLWLGRGKKTEKRKRSDGRSR